MVSTPVAGHVDGESLPWAQWSETIWVKILRCDEATGAYTMLSRFGPGTQLPKHRHFGPVSAWTIQGTWRYLEYDWVAKAGDFVFEAPGSEHTLVTEGDEDTLILFQIEGGILMVGPEGELWMYEDLQTARERYYLALQLQGVEPPVDILGKAS